MTYNVFGGTLNLAQSVCKANGYSALQSSAKKVHLQPLAELQDRKFIIT